MRLAQVCGADFSLLKVMSEAVVLARVRSATKMDVTILRRSNLRKYGWRLPN